MDTLPKQREPSRDIRLLIGGLGYDTNEIVNLIWRLLGGAGKLVLEQREPNTVRVHNCVGLTQVNCCVKIVDTDGLLFAQQDSAPVLEAVLGGLRNRTCLTNDEWRETTSQDAGHALENAMFIAPAERFLTEEKSWYNPLTWREPQYTVYETELTELCQLWNNVHKKISTEAWLVLTHCERLSPAARDELLRVIASRASISRCRMLTLNKECENLKDDLCKRQVCEHDYTAASRQLIENLFTNILQYM